MTTTSPTTTHMPVLPQQDGGIFITDGGLETTLLFLEGIDLPDFAAFPLLDSEDGRAALRRYFTPYLDIAERAGTGIVLDAPTWRANADWGTRLGYDHDALAAINVRAVEFVKELAAEHPGLRSVVNGVHGPRGDGYVVGAAMTADEATRYHALQARAFAAAGADMATAVTMTYVGEAIGVARAAADAGLPSVIGFTVETDGRLPSGDTLVDAIAAVDACGAAPAYFMVNCAHPSHFEATLGDADAATLARIGAIRANASRMSHEELDNAEELDRGDPAELRDDYRRLGDLLSNLCVVGGCCGTDHGHIDEIAGALIPR